MVTQSLSLSYALDNAYFLRNGQKKEVYLYLSLTGSASQHSSQRPPLNLALVLDRSGSMAGEKLAYAKKAISFVVNHLSPSDTLSIVQYDDKVEVVQKAAPVQNKELLHQQVDRIAAGGATNLSGGMVEGYKQVNAAKQPTHVNRILLLSDGLANVGVTEPAELQQVAQQQFRQAQLSLSTFGVGADFNEDLMTNLAEYGAGNYFFIESPDQIPAIFAKELSGLLSVVAQGAQVEITFPDSYLTCSRVYGYPYVVEEDRVVIKSGDVFSREEKGILLKFDCHQSFERDIAFGISLTYGDAAAQLSPVKERYQLPLQVTESEEVFRSGLNGSVMEQVALFVGNSLLEEAIQEAENHHYEQAGQKAEGARVYLEAYLKAFPESTRLRTQYDQITDYQQIVPRLQDFSREERSTSLKMSKYMSYSSRKGRS